MHYIWSVYGQAIVYWFPVLIIDFVVFVYGTVI